MHKKITAKKTKKLLSSNKEISLIDIRETGPHSNGHPFFSISIPYSVFEIELKKLVPNKKVMVIIFDQNDNLSEIAFKQAQKLGYKNLFVLENGIKGWVDQGYKLFDGINVPSKAFGEMVELKNKTPYIKPATLVQKIKSKENILILDGRPFDEFKKMNIPNGICCPNMEMPVRIEKKIDKKTEIIVNCAGRTRSIIGAQNLINYGINNKVKALENGTQGWFLSDLKLEQNQNRKLPLPKLKTNKTFTKKAAELIEKFKLQKINFKEASNILKDKSRTTYLFDITTREKKYSNFYKGIRNAPGGQLIQATDKYIGVMNSQIILLDDGDLIRSTMTASWLKKMGYHAFIYDGDQTKLANLLPKIDSKNHLLKSNKIKSLFDQIYIDFKILDIRNSHSFKKAHLKKSTWLSRSNLRFINLKTKKKLLIVYDNLTKAKLIENDIKEKYNFELYFYKFVENDFHKFPNILTTNTNYPKKTDCIDFVYHTHKRHSGSKNHAKKYLNWEMSLINKMDKEERKKFIFQ